MLAAAASALLVSTSPSLPTSSAFVLPVLQSGRSSLKSLPSSLFISSRVQARADVSAEEALERTKAHLERLKQRVPRKKSGTVDNSTQDLHPQQKQSIALETLYGQYILQSANSLKQELKSRRLNNKGRKPDMARRLAQHDLALANINNTSENDLEPDIQKIPLL